MTSLTKHVHRPFMVTYRRLWYAPWAKRWQVRCMNCLDAPPEYRTRKQAQAQVEAQRDRDLARLNALANDPSRHQPSGLGWPR